MQSEAACTCMHTDGVTHLILHITIDPNRPCMMLWASGGYPCFCCMGAAFANSALFPAEDTPRLRARTLLQYKLQLRKQSLF